MTSFYGFPVTVTVVSGPTALAGGAGYNVSFVFGPQLTTSQQQNFALFYTAPATLALFNITLLAAQPYSTVGSTAAPGLNGAMLTPIIGGAIAGVVVLLLVAVGCVVYRQRNPTKNAGEKSDDQEIAFVDTQGGGRGGYKPPSRA